MLGLMEKQASSRKRGKRYGIFRYEKTNHGTMDGE